VLTVFNLEDARQLRASCSQAGYRADAIRIAVQYLADADAGPDVLVLAEGGQSILEEIAAMRR
jgi:hypothetical protein